MFVIPGGLTFAVVVSPMVCLPRILRNYILMIVMTIVEIQEQGLVDGCYIGF